MHRAYRFLPVSVLLAVFLMANVATAQERIVVMGFRTTAQIQSGIVQSLNGVLWQKVTQIPNIAPLAEPQLAAMLGGNYASLATCDNDACMQNAVMMAGANSCIWGFIESTPQGQLKLSVRKVTHDGDVNHVDTESPAASPALMVPALSKLDLVSLVLGLTPPPPGGPGGVGAQPDVISAPTASPSILRPTAALPPENGLATLETSPSGAMVLFQGQSVGQTPLRELQLQPGIYEVKLAKDGFRQKDVRFEVRAGGHVEKRWTMEPTHGTLRVVTSPVGATIKVDGQDAGKAPVQGYSVLAGRVTVEAHLEDHDIESQQVSVTPGKRTSVTINLQPNVGQLVINSTPAGAAVRIDGQEMGVTPLRNVKVLSGTRQVALSMPGYDAFSQEVEVKGGGRHQVNAKLAKEPPLEGLVSFRSTPDGARVFANGVEIGTTPLPDFKLHFGHYVIHLVKDGCNPHEMSIEVERGKKMNVERQLEKAPPPAGMGLFTLHVTPKGAEVVVGGRPFAAGEPVEDFLIAAGRYDVEIRLEGYKPDRFQVDVVEGKTTTMERKLSKLPPPPPQGFLSVTSTPPGARVLVGDQDLGVTPIDKAGVPVGNHAVSVHLQDHHAGEQKVTIRRGRKSSMTFDLRSRFASLKVTSNPPGATVFLNGQHIGDTPNTFTRLQGGNYSIIVAKIGHQEAMGQVILKEGEITAVNYDLTDAPGLLSIRTRPEGTTIFIGGKEVGKSPLNRIELPAGEHTVEARAEGFLPATGKVNIEPRKERTLRFELETVPAAPVDMNRSRNPDGTLVEPAP